MLRSCFALALASTFVLPATAALAAPAPITAIATQTSHKTVGKAQTFSETLRVGGKVIGTDKITCARQTKTVAKCSGVFTLGKGQIMVSGNLYANKKTDSLAIVGGTGTYKGAKGVFTVHGKTETLKFL